MDLRRWEDLNTDCLVQVFKKVDSYTLLIGVQFVCKSCFKASLHKECWEILDFQYAGVRDVNAYLTRLHKTIKVLDSGKYLIICNPYARARANDNDYNTHLYNTRLIKTAVSRSRGTVTKAVLPRLFETDALRCIVDECSGLKSLELPTLGKEYCCHDPFFGARRWFLDILSKLKNLEVLNLGFVPDNLIDILSVLKLQGNNLVSLSVSKKNCAIETCSSQHYMIGRKIGSAIVELFPKIQYLTFGHCCFEREELLKILTGCIELVLFDIRDSNGFGSLKLDEEILKKASHIKRFLFSEFGWYLRIIYAI